MVGHRLSFVDNKQKVDMTGTFIELSSCHGNSCVIINILKVLPDNSFANISTLWSCNQVMLQ